LGIGCLFAFAFAADLCWWRLSRHLVGGRSLTFSLSRSEPACFSLGSLREATGASWDWRAEQNSVEFFTAPPNCINPSLLLPSQLRPLLQQPSIFECQVRPRHNTLLPAIFKHPVERETKHRLHRLHSLLLADPRSVSLSKLFARTTTT
jgi:hypothetical protein